MTIKALRTYSLIRNFLFRMVNKEFLIFLFFLVLSGIFWLLMTLNQTFEKDLVVEVQLVKIPKNVVITNEPATTIRVTLRDKGYMIGGYMYGRKLKPVVIDFSAYANGKGYGVVSSADLQKQLLPQLYKSTTILAVKPDKVEFHYNFGRNKKVPIRLLGGIAPDKGYYLSHLSFSPDSVTVYASKSLLDSITVVYTERQHIVNFRDTLIQQVPLRKIRGAKLEPSVVQVKLFPDILTEESVEVPIQAINMPDDKVLRTFPPKVKVSFAIGANRIRLLPKNPETKQLLPQGFRVLVDYNDIKDDHSDKCRITLAATPNGIRNARLAVSEVDYLLESK